MAVGETREPAVELTGITKRFPGVLANDAVDLTVAKGEIHGLVGENGAGKSTLMNVLAGVHRPDAGTIRVLGSERQFRTAADAIQAGIGMVHQHFMLIPSFTVLDNLILGLEPVRLGGLLDRGAARARAAELARRHGFQVDLAAPVASLPVVLQQQVEVLKCLLQGAEVMIFDEPTSVLAPQESEALLATMRELAAAGRTIILITHKLREVMAVCDRVTVLRDGRVTGVVSAAEASERTLARLMVGRDIELPRRGAGPGAVAPGVTGPGVAGAAVDVAPAAAAAPAAPRALEVRGLVAERAGAGRRALGPVDLVVGAGEIVGVAAIAGNGQAELVEAVVGLREARGGSVALAGEDVTGWGVRRRRAGGLAYIPQDRRGRGTAPTRTVLQNAIAARYRSPDLQRWGWLDGAKARRLAADIVRRFDVRTSGLNATGLTLSGGNLQKLVVGRELEVEPRLLVAEDPTQGIDIGSVEAVRHHLLSAAERGCGVLLVSQDLSEVIALSDRVIVLYEGKVAGECLPGPGVEQTLGLLMTGAAST